MSGVAASFHQASAILKLLDETKWTRDEMQRKFFARWGLLRQIAEAVDELGEEQVRAMHPLFYGKTVKPAFPSEAIAREYGYTVVEDVEPTLKSVADLGIVICLYEPNLMVPGETIHRYAKRIGANLGLVDLKFALDRRAKIPVKMMPYRIFFSGTKLRGPRDEVVVAYLAWEPGGWRVGFLPLDGNGIDSVRLARCKSAA